MEPSLAEQQTTSRRALSVAFLWVALAYVAAGIVAYVVATRWLVGASVWQVVGAADIAATIVVFAFSVAFNNSSFYDPYWSVAPMVIAPSLAGSFAVAGVPSIRRFIVIGLVHAWGARLTWNWARSWRGISHEDWRYVDLRKTTGRAYWLVSLLGLHMMPTLWVYLGSLSMIPALCTGTRPMGLLDVAGFVVTAGAIVIETVADEQLRVFRRDHAASGEIMARGLWRFSRHPNYLGEISFWWGLWLFAFAADPAAWKFVLGPIAINALFVFISVPMLDRRSLARRRGYDAHMRNVPGILPRPWRMGSN